jgi:hypothetical protein
MPQKLECASFMDQMGRQMKLLEQRNLLEAPSPEPRITIQLPEAGRIHLVLRFPAPDPWSFAGRTGDSPTLSQSPCGSKVLRRSSSSVSLPNCCEACEPPACPAWILRLGKNRKQLANDSLQGIDEFCTLAASMWSRAAYFNQGGE